MQYIMRCMEYCDGIKNIKTKLSLDFQTIYLTY